MSGGQGHAPTPRSRLALGFGVCALIWGSTFLAISVGNDTVPPMWAATLRLVLASLILVPLAWLTGGGLPRGAAFKAAALFGVFQFGLNFPLLYWAETVLPSGLTAVVFATIPLTSSLLARLLGMERLDRVRLIGAGLALAGIAVLFSSRLSARASSLALLASYAATVVAALGTLLLKRGPRQSPIGANAVAAAVGAVMCLALSLLAREARVMPTHRAQWFPIVYLALAGSVGAFVVFSWLVQRMDVSRASFIGVIVPVIALALGTLLRHEPFGRDTALGAPIVLLGVCIGLGAFSRPRAAAPH